MNPLRTDTISTTQQHNREHILWDIMYNNIQSVILGCEVDVYGS